MKHIRFVLLILWIAISSSCSLSERQAYKLYKNGDYNGAIEQFPDAPFADSARAMILFQSGQYDTLLQKYPSSSLRDSAWYMIAQKLSGLDSIEVALNSYANTPAYDLAKSLHARRLLKEGKYEAVFEKYQYSDEAGIALDSLGAREYRLGKIEVLYEKFKGTYFAELAKKTHKSEWDRLVSRDEAIERKKREAEDAAMRKRNQMQMAEAKRMQAEHDREKANLKRECRYNPPLCLQLGMSEQQVVEWIGRPNDINNTEFMAFGAMHRNSQWVYDNSRNYSYDMVYLYFENGILTSWQY